MKDDQVKKTPLYLKFYKRYRTESNVLHDSSARSFQDLGFNPDSKTSLLTNQIVLVGDSRGEYKQDTQVKKAYIPAAEAALELVEKQIKNYYQIQINAGKNPKALTLTDELLEKKAVTLARLDVYREELEKIERLLSEWEEIEEEESSARLLKGRLGSSKLRGGVLREADGQSVKVVEGLLRIWDERSPYHKMEAWKYTAEICKPVNREWELRQNAETKLAISEGRRPRNIGRPKLPTYDAKTGLIEYFEYSNTTLNKLKK